MNWLIELSDDKNRRKQEDISFIYSFLKQFLQKENILEL